MKTVAVRVIAITELRPGWEDLQSALELTLRMSEKQCSELVKTLLGGMTHIQADAVLREHAAETGDEDLLAALKKAEAES